MHINPTPFPVLTTNRLILRALNPGDGDALFRLRSDERVNRYLNRESAITKADADAFIQKINQLIQDNRSFYWALNLKDNPELIGTICYWNLDTEKDMAEIGYELLPDYQGKGLMQEAITAVIHYGFNEIRLKAITALPHPANENSVKLLKRNDFWLDAKHEYVTEEEADGLAVYVRMV